MRQRATWRIVLCFILVLAPMALPAEPLPPPETPAGAEGWLSAGSGQPPGVSCAETSPGSFVIRIDSLERDPLGNAHPMTSPCCSRAACCFYIESGCHPCGQGGLHWYERYRCNGGDICMAEAIACPTPC